MPIYRIGIGVVCCVAIAAIISVTVVSGNSQIAAVAIPAILAFSTSTILSVFAVLKGQNQAIDEIRISREQTKDEVRQTKDEVRQVKDTVKAQKKLLRAELLKFKTDIYEISGNGKGNGNGKEQSSDSTKAPSQ